MLHFYAYKGCDSCRKARKWMQENAIEFEELAIRDTPPSLQELAFALQSQGSLKPLFNSSGMDYRSMGMKDKLHTLSDDEALELLSTHGNLIKRPFIIDQDKGIHLTGFKEAVWSDTLLG